MKLYRKQLDGLDELQREKIKLRYQRMHLDKLHSTPEDVVDSKGSGGNGIFGTIMSLVGENGGLEMAMQIGSGLFSRMKERRRERKYRKRALAGFPEPKSTTRKIAEDILWSYLVGKAIRVSVGILQQSVKKKKGPQI